MTLPEFVLQLAFVSSAAVAALLFCQWRKRRARRNQMSRTRLGTALLAFEACLGRAFPCRTLMILLATIHFLSAAVAISQVPPQNKVVKPGRGLAQSSMNLNSHMTLASKEANLVSERPKVSDVLEELKRREPIFFCITFGVRNDLHHPKPMSRK
jgi:hypothetical protein